jgi:hypothetical protein
MARKKIHDALDRLAAAERSFVGSMFLAPVVRGGGGVSVRIAGVICAMHVMPRDFEGFGVFRARSHTEAELVREAGLAERRRYLELFPRVSLVICARTKYVASAIPANAADGRFSVEGEIELRLVGAEGIELFDTVVARFDGRYFWLDRLDARADPAIAPHLRRSLANTTEPTAALDRPALSSGHRTAYWLAYKARLEAMIEDERSRGEYRLRDALAHAGAQLRDFVEHRDTYRVTYEFDGERHVSVVRKDDLTIQTAGICLSGLDANFDLASLVGVLRESRGHFD